MKIIPLVSIEEGVVVKEATATTPAQMERKTHPALLPVEIKDEKEANRLIERGLAKKATSEAVREASDLAEDFPYRALLIGAKLITKEQLRDVSDAELKEVRGIGDKSVVEIRAALKG